MQPHAMCFLSILLILDRKTETVLTFPPKERPLNPTSNNREKQGESSVLINEKQVQSRFLVNERQGESSIVVDEEVRFGTLQVASRVYAVEGA